MHFSKLLLASTVLTMVAGTASADGWTLSHGRFPGKVITFHLSSEQKQFVSFARRCDTDNTKSPYVFRLTPSQSAKLKSVTSKSPSRFAIFDSTAGDIEVDLPINVIIRYTDEQFEVPLRLVTSSYEALKYEQDVIGWAYNPLETASLHSVQSGKCPVEQGLTTHSSGRSSAARLRAAKFRR